MLYRMTIELPGDVPSKKNSRRHVIAGGRVLNIPSKAYAAWHEEMSWRLAAGKPAAPIERARIALTFYPRTRRLFDISNKVESVLDLLVDCGYLVDDNYRAVPELRAAFGEVDRERPRAVVDIFSLSQN